MPLLRPGNSLDVYIRSSKRLFQPCERLLIDRICTFFRLFGDMTADVKDVGYVIVSHLSMLLPDHI